MISYFLGMACPSSTAASWGSKEITWLIMVVIKLIFPVFSPRSALIYPDLPVGYGSCKPCRVDKLCLLFPGQLDNVDEQAAQIRRELDGRLQLAEKIARVRNLYLLLSLQWKHQQIAVFIIVWFADKLLRFGSSWWVHQKHSQKSQTSHFESDSVNHSEPLWNESMRIFFFI